MVAKTYINNIQDFKGPDGLWTKYVFFSIGERSSTRSYTLWKNVNYRTKEEGLWQHKHPDYVDSRNLFIDYQIFTDWCQCEFGYTSKDNSGRFWHLDKDLINHGNKNYSPDTCMFVPNEINKLLSFSKGRQGDYPLGVYLHSGKYKAQISNGENKRIYLGHFNDPRVAHKAWQEAKISVIESILDRGYIQGHEKLLKSLQAHIDRLENDIKNNLETVS